MENTDLLEKLKSIEDRFNTVTEQISLSETVKNKDLFRDLCKEQKRLTPIVDKYREYIKVLENINDAKEMIAESDDSDLRDMCNEEIKESNSKLERIEEEIKILLLPKDENDDRNVVIEIRQGAGGDEAALFAAVLYRMYSMYASAQKFKIDLVNANETGLGGFKEVTFTIEGDGAFSKFKYESGVHRVQRVPETESQGRIHTSTVTVAVLPEAEDIEVDIQQSDLKIDTIKSTGAGGQHINKTESAIRLTHLPTGIVVECQDERSQFKNREKAMKILAARLYEIKQNEEHEKIASERKSQVGTGDRSERIRTYNYPQGRVTDHRIGLTLHSLEDFLNGNIGEMIEALATADMAEKLKNAE